MSQPFSFQQFLSCCCILFATLNVPGNLAVVVNMRKKGSAIDPWKIAIVAILLMLSFLLGGSFILTLFGVNTPSFILAGSIIILLLGLDMCLNISIFKMDPDTLTASVVPLAFPIIVGPGTFSMLLILKAEFQFLAIVLASFTNVVIIYFVLKYSQWLEIKIGKLGIAIIQKFMGLMLIAMAFQHFKTYLFG